MDIDKYFELLENEKILPLKDLKLLCEFVRDILQEESNVQPIQAPVIVCGDIHG